MPPVNGQDSALSGIPAPTTYGVWGDSQSGDGVLGTSENLGVHGVSENGTAVYGRTVHGVGVGGRSDKSHGVSGQSKEGAGVYAAGDPAVFAIAKDSALGVQARSERGAGVYAESDDAHGVQGLAKGAGDGVHGESYRGHGVQGFSAQASGVRGRSQHASGVEGRSDTAAGVLGDSALSYGVAGYGHGDVPVEGSGSRGGVGVYGCANSGSGIPHWVPCGVVGDAQRGSGGAIGVLGLARRGTGVYGGGPDDGLGVAAVGWGNHGHGLYAYGKAGAGQFDGNVNINGVLFKLASFFRIDHPDDPGNRYLTHAAVEAPEYKTFYDGVAGLNRKGEATIRLPRWFKSLNTEFRYQLTPLGGPAPDLHVAEEIHDNRFRIAGGRAGLKVSWQVTAVRRDAWARRNPLAVETRKPKEERGHYLQPSAHGKGETHAIRGIRGLEQPRPSRRGPGKQ